MKPPVEHVRVTAKGKEILVKVKRNTGLEHWNEICRIALCRSLANPTPPPPLKQIVDSSIDIEWKTFAGQLSEPIAALTYIRAYKEGIDIRDRDEMSNYFKSHLERGILSLQTTKDLRSTLI